MKIIKIILLSCLFIHSCVSYNYVLSGKVEDSTGTALADVTVREVSSSEYFRSNVDTLITSSDGSYMRTTGREKECGGGGYIASFVFEKSGYKSFSYKVDITADNKTLNVIMELNASGSPSREK